MSEPMAVAEQPVQELAQSELVAQARRVGQEVAQVHADRVDRAGAFPHETIQALREAKLLGAYVPRELGGRGATMAELSAMCTGLGQHCATSAMVFAMHTIQVACIVDHGLSQPLFRAYAAENLVGKQELLASATTEAGVGGDVRTSMCAVQEDGDHFRLEKNAPVISYGAQCDGILATARRAPDSQSSDQVLCLVRKQDFQLEKTSEWDTLGFRGTCSNGFMLRARADRRQILPVPYADISARTMLPVSHLVWSSLWFGIALDAAERARAFVRAQARQKPGVTPPGALRLAELHVKLQGLRANLAEAVRAYSEALSSRDSDALGSMGLALRMNNLKIAASQQVVELVGEAMLICGIASYKLDSRYSLSRQLRDAYGAALMINNDRIYGSNASMLLIYKGE